MPAVLLGAGAVVCLWQAGVWLWRRRFRGLLALFPDEIDVNI